MIIALIAILAAVMILPFLFHKVEKNLEAFLFIMGFAAVIISGRMSTHLVAEAFKQPIAISSAVLLAGALFYVFKHRITHIMEEVYKKVPTPLVVFIIITVLGLMSSIITAIVAAIILVELIALLPMSSKQKNLICIIACFSIGCGAVLTPLGEPLATIAISKLDKAFFYIFKLLGCYILPLTILLGLLGAIYTWRISKVDNRGKLNASASKNHKTEEEMIMDESWRSIIFRALKVYLFVMALVFLGEGFEPLINKYILGLDNRVLYWANMVSAILDNATLAAAELSPNMGALQVRSILLGLLISGGMLVPGNIPNIVAASKLRISMTEWAKIGVPLGLIIMTIIYFIEF